MSVEAESILGKTGAREGLFDLAYIFTARWEGGLSDHPADRGGVTKFGVSREFLADMQKRERHFLRSLGIAGEITGDVIRNLSRDQARRIFRYEFWDSLELDREIHPKCAVVLFDMAVNHGKAGAVKIAQRGVNKTAPLCPLLKVDGKLGPKTRKGLANADFNLPQLILDAREAYFLAIVAKNASQKVFLAGWLNRCDDLRRYVEKI